MLDPDRIARLRAMAADASASFVVRWGVAKGGDGSLWFRDELGNWELDGLPVSWNCWELRRTISRRKAIREDAARGMIIDTKEAA
jgi:hypothetical protein